MGSKRHISYQWRIFIPSVLCLWVVIFGMFQWQVVRVKEVRNEMAFDQLDVIGSRIVNLHTKRDTTTINQFADFSSNFYAVSEHYDPMCIWIVSTENDSVTKRFGTFLRPDFPLPVNKRGNIMVDKKYIGKKGADDTQFIYSVYLSPEKDRKVYIFLPYTKRLLESINSRVTYFWLIFVAVGLFVTILMFISISYFGRNIKMLKTFSYQASTNPQFVPPTDIEFSNDELGDISKQILEIYNQRMNELERREREHKIAMNAIDEKNRIKREMTGNINHELKTPVGVIQGYIDTMVDNPQMDAETRDKFLQKTQDSVRRLVSLIKDITDITKLESGGKLVNVGEINFHDLVFSFDNMLHEGNVLQGKMTFEYDLPLNCMVLGNDGLLTTVLLNLVKNSVAYSGGTECHLMMTNEDDDFYYFKYYDNGVGVPPEHLPHMFERFYRVNAGRSRNTGGTGLGLSIVEVTIETFGGKIDVMNHFPTGLEYNFSLPRYKKKE